jgi:hypothetical protein
MFGSCDQVCVCPEMLYVHFWPLTLIKCSCEALIGPQASKCLEPADCPIKNARLSHVQSKMLHLISFDLLRLESESASTVAVLQGRRVVIADGRTWVAGSTAADQAVNTTNTKARESELTALHPSLSHDSRHRQSYSCCTHLDLLHESVEEKINRHNPSPTASSSNLLCQTLRSRPFFFEAYVGRKLIKLTVVD